ncbi:hypothetical protein MKW98_005417, partial [Papaver atlanticum]
TLSMYLFVRCDNEPAPWTSDVHGDCPRSLPVIKELNGATDATDRKDGPFWDYDVCLICVAPVKSQMWSFL